MADARLTIARRELAVLKSEKTIVLALLIQLFIAAFSSFLVVGLVSLYDPGSVHGYTVTVGVTGDASDDLVAVADAQDGVRAVPFDSEAAAMSAFHGGTGANGGVDAVLRATRENGRIHVVVTAPDDDIRSTLVVVRLRDTLRALERTERSHRSASLTTRPIDLPPRTQSSPYYGFTYTVLVPLLLFLPVFISGSIVVDSVTEEFDRGTFELLRVAPLSLSDIVDGKLLAAAALAPAQAALWLLLLRLNGTRVDHLGTLLVLVAALSLLVVSLGVSVALFAPDRRVAQFVYSLGVLLVFGGSTLLPLNPANAAARLAIGSSNLGVVTVVGVYVALATTAYWALRRTARRVSLA